MSTPRTPEQRQRLMEIREKSKLLQAGARARMERHIASLMMLYDDFVDELIDLEIAIHEAQEYKSGAILLELYKCTDELCAGCPHTRWKKWQYKSSKATGKKGFWVADKIASPKRHARAKSVPEEARWLIARAEVVIKKREDLMAQTRKMGVTVAHLEAHHFEA